VFACVDQAELGFGEVGAQGEEGAESAHGCGLRDGDWEGWRALA
jgi:hypothetical protein